MTFFLLVAICWVDGLPIMLIDGRWSFIDESVNAVSVIGFVALDESFWIGDNFNLCHLI